MGNNGTLPNKIKCLMNRSSIKVASSISFSILVLSSSLANLACADTIEFSDGASISSAAPADKLGQAGDPRLSHLIKGVKLYSHSLDAQQIALLAKDGIRISSTGKENCLGLEDGNVLFVPDKNILVDTAHGRLELGAGAIVFAMVSNDGLVLYDLRQSSAKQVSILIDDQKIFIEPGYMLVVTKYGNDNFEKLDLDCHSIIHGVPQKVILSTKNANVFLSEFSISATFLTVKPLRQLIASNDKYDKATFEKILKGAAALHDYLGPIQPAQLAHTNRQL